VLLAWAVSCESYELREDGTADIFAAGFDTLYVDGLPAKLGVTILVRLLLQEGEKGEIEVQVLGPDTVSLGTLIHEIEAEPSPNHRPGYLVSQTEGLEIVFPAETEGVYSIELYTDKPHDAVSEERRRSIFLNIRDGLPE
jgi:hypothetical protein